MSWLLKFWDSTVGKKVVMAATGILLVGFVLGHMAGNLQMFLGADAMNRYAAFLKSTGELLWVARLGLLGAVTLHIVAAVQLTRRNAAARPQGYAKSEPQVSTSSSTRPTSGSTGHRGRHRPRRRLRRRDARRARLQREVLLLPGQPAPRPLDRRPGRHQRRQELPERRRQRLPPLLRHGQGRRLPRPRGQRLPPRRGLGQHHRPVRRAGRALRPRVRRPARQPLLRRRAGLAHLLRPRPDRPAAAARRLPGAERQIGAGTVKMFTRTEMLDLVVVDGQAAASSCATWSPARSSRHAADAVVLATGGYGNVFYLSTNAKGCNVTATWRATSAAPASPTPATRRSTRPASRSAATTSRS
jgi:hypothetical protein